MKRIYLIALMGIFAMGFASCGDNENEEVKTYFTVTFDTDGGIPVPEKQRVEEGKTAVAPSPAPTKTGFVFVVWTADGTNAYDFRTPVTRDLTLRAKWKENGGTVTESPKIGDYYYSDGSFSKELNNAKTCMGIVVREKTAQQKGLIVSHDVKDAGGWWMPVTATGFVYKLTNAKDENDGAKNLEKIKKWRDWEKWYPAFSWCAKKGNGWYLPAINELKTLCDVLFENSTLNAKLEAIPGGKPLTLPQYWSSTEKSDRTALVYVPQLKSVVARNKTYAQSSNVSTRAIRAF
ncbi:MAG: InlB B-repeat-containing protein [Tannerella sp.]|uniref:InlB B-repeat-containing protein n=1 Tax=Tannerella sp. TaxID=2382127 RepID=UPI003FA21A1A